MIRKRVERIWKQEGLKVPRKHPKRGRLWLKNGSCVRLRPLKILTVIDQQDAARLTPERRVVYTLHEAEVLLERWRCHYTHEHPHSSLSYKPPGPKGSVT